MGLCARILLLFSWSVLACSLLAAMGHVISPYEEPANSQTKTVSTVEQPCPSGKLLVRATGDQYFWRFRYAGFDGQFQTSDDVHSYKQLHLPLGCDVELLVESNDFVYSFSAPALKLRKIAVPELRYSLEFHTHQTGEFDLIVDPFCGVSVFHDEDMGRIVVESQDEFQDWYASTSARKTSR